MSDPSSHSVDAAGAEGMPKRGLIERWGLNRPSRVLMILAIALFTLLWMVPLIWSLSLSFRPELAIKRDASQLLPIPFTLENWTFMLSSSRIGRWFVNSTVVASVHTVLLLVVTAPAAYAFARLDFPGRRVLFTVAIAGLMVPFEATFIPIYLLFADLDLHNTYIALILPGLASPFGLFLLVQFFKGIPVELEESAYVDGASHWQVFRRVILPLSKPVLTTLAIFAFFANWNAYLWPLISATDPDVMTLTVGLKNLSASFGYSEFLGRIMAASWIAVVPLGILFLVLQKRVLDGISMSSGIKG